MIIKFDIYNESVRDLMKPKSEEDIKLSFRNLTQKEKDDKLLGASETAYLNVIKYLLKFGADINVKDMFGWTPLMYAVNSSDLETVKYLVEYGADIDIKNNNGFNALMLALDADYLDVANYLDLKSKKIDESVRDLMKPKSEEDILSNIVNLTQEEKDENIVNASLYNYLNVIKQLIKSGADVNARIKHGWGWSALMCASLKNNLDTVIYLIEKGADVNLKDNLIGNTALTLASKHGHLTTVKYLVEHGADVNTLNNIGFSPLMGASDGYLDVVKYLIEQGAHINIKDTMGVTALSVASRKNNTEIINYLKEYSAKEKLNESVRDLMKPKSEEEVEDNVDKLLRKFPSMGTFHYKEYGLNIDFEHSKFIQDYINTHFILYDKDDNHWIMELVGTVTNNRENWRRIEFSAGFKNEIDDLGITVNFFDNYKELEDYLEELGYTRSE